MILSASRRTDIPAFYATWLMNRLREGRCLVPNPFRPSQVREVSLRREDVGALVLWSKNPAPLMPRLDELSDLGIPFYVQLTLNAYPESLEPGLPRLEERMATFRRLSETIGPHRVVWRYDPVLVSNVTGRDFHARHFESLCRALSGSTTRVMVSVVDFYRKTGRRLRGVPGLAVDAEENDPRHPSMQALLEHMAGLARGSNIEILSCAEEHDLSDLGIRPGHCIDPAILARMGVVVADDRKDPGQRKACLCAKSIDIGMVDTCVHGCVYCYATRDPALAQSRHGRHDPDSPMLMER